MSQISDIHVFEIFINVPSHECSCAVKEYTVSEHTNVQFVKLYNHRVNAARYGCKIVKYHIIATLFTTGTAHLIKL